MQKSILTIVSTIIVLVIIYIATVPVKSHSQAASILAEHGTVEIIAGSFYYTSNKEIITSLEIEALSKMTEVYSKMYISSKD